MMKLTIDMIARQSSGQMKKKREEDIQHYLHRLTHLYLEDCKIDEIGDVLSSCKSLVVLYLYDNFLQHVPQLDRNTNVTHLYLQNNQIKLMTGFASLIKLTKLYIGGNCISVVEGLHKLNQLQELHVENQKLAAGEKLLFDPRSIKSLQSSLEVLNVSGNRLTSLQDFKNLGRLTQFMAMDNCLADMKDVAMVLTSWKQLNRLDLCNNPISQQPKYRDHVIIMTHSLDILDGKEVTETARQFLQNWHASKLLVRDRVQRQQSGLLRQSHDANQSDYTSEISPPQVSLSDNGL